MRSFLFLPFTLALAACGGSEPTYSSSSSSGISASSSSSSSSSTSSSSSSSSSGTALVTDAFATHSLSSALGTASSVPQQLVASYLDSNKTTHIAWVHEYADGDERIKYATYTAEGVYQETAISHDPVQLIGSVKMAVDDNGVAHIVWFVKRDTDEGTRSGNYAVYYASNSDGSFTSAQVSENATDPTDDTNGLYNAYVNGRPEVFLNGASPYVLFTADASSDTSWDNWVILAQPAGSGFSLQQLINTDELEGTHSPQHDTVVARQSSADGPFVWMDISDYNVHALNANGDDNYLTGLGGFGNVTDVQAVDDGQGNTYAIWLRDYSDDTTGDDYAFYISKIVDDTPSQPVRLPIEATSVTGNFAPAAIDPVSGRFYLIYYVGGLGSASSIQLITYDPASGLYTEISLPEHSGYPDGEDSLWAYDNTLVYTTTSGGDTIHIHRWDDMDQRVPLAE